MELDAKRNELASQRIAFEEEKLARLSSEGQASDSEAEVLRLKLKEQVGKECWTDFRLLDGLKPASLSSGCFGN